MRKQGCIHPQIMAALSKCGHGDKLLIADGNFPLDSKCPQCEKVYLGLVEGEPTVTAVLSAVLQEISVEAAEVMTPGDGSRPEIFDEFQTMLGGMELKELGRYPFYDEAGGGAVRLAIHTGEKRVFANILLTVGVA